MHCHSYLFVVFSFPLQILQICSYNIYTTHERLVKNLRLPGSRMETAKCQNYEYKNTKNTEISVFEYGHFATLFLYQELPD